MPTFSSLFPNGVRGLFPDVRRVIVVQFTDVRHDVPAGQQQVWSGILHYAEVASNNPGNIMLTVGSPAEFVPWIQDIKWAAINSLTPLTDPNFSLAIGGRIGFLVTFQPTTQGNLNGRFRLTSSLLPQTAYVWVRPPVRRAHMEPIADYRDLDVVTGPIFENTLDFSANVFAPNIRVFKETKAKTFLIVTNQQSIKATALLQVRSHFVKANTKLLVGKKFVTKGDMWLIVSGGRIINVKTRLRVGKSVVVNVGVVLAVRTYFVFAGALLRVGETRIVNASSFLRIGGGYTAKSFVLVQVAFIDVRDMKRDMQIQFGADTELTVEQFQTIPPQSGVVYTKILKFALIDPGSESVRRVGAGVEAENAINQLIYGIDYTRGKFVWFGADIPEISISYRHSVSRVTDENISAAIVKATSVIIPRLRTDTDTRDPRFTRGCVELAMSFLMDSAIWSATNAIKDFKRQSKRIDSLAALKRDFERRGFETLAPFIDTFSPGSPELLKLPRNRHFKAFEG